MEIDPEYASLVVPTMVICKSFLEIFQAESVWVPGVSLLDGIAYDYGDKERIYEESSIILKMISWWHPRNCQTLFSGKDHIKGTTDMALTIFDSIKKIQGWEQRERLLLQIAVSAA